MGCGTQRGRGLVGGGLSGNESASLLARDCRDGRATLHRYMVGHMVGQITQGPTEADGQNQALAKENSVKTVKIQAHANKNSVNRCGGPWVSLRTNWSPESALA